jgi:hypothetical protein
VGGRVWGSVCGWGGEAREMVEWRAGAACDERVRGGARGESLRGRRRRREEVCARGVGVRARLAEGWWARAGRPFFAVVPGFLLRMFDLIRKICLACSTIVFFTFCYRSDVWTLPGFRGKIS